MLIKHWVTGHLRERLIQDALERGETIQYETAFEAEVARLDHPVPTKHTAVIAALRNDLVPMIRRDVTRLYLSTVTAGDYTFVDCPIWKSNGLYADPYPLAGVPLRVLYGAEVIFDKNNLVTGLLQDPPKSRSDELSEAIFQLALNSNELKSKFGVQP